ncbi:MAG: TetR/AcrR family transcriptional regulator [Coriobacteriales bacterium]|nr:TetR/AcrR family transcriptional regulator [Coriobacteriales bacterium]
MSDNPIALRSKKKLIDALGKLLNEQTYKDITITKLCQEAKLSRPAFYQNFDSIAEATEKCIGAHAHESYNRVGLRRVKGSEDLANFFLDIMNSDSNFITRMIEQGLDEMVAVQYARVFASADQTLKLIDDVDDDSLKSYYAEFIGAGSGSTLTRWFSEENTLTRNEVISIISTMISAAMPKATKATQKESSYTSKIG